MAGAHPKRAASCGSASQHMMHHACPVSTAKSAHCTASAHASVCQCRVPTFPDAAEPGPLRLAGYWSQPPGCARVLHPAARPPEVMRFVATGQAPSSRQAASAAGPLSVPHAALLSCASGRGRPPAQSQVEAVLPCMWPFCIIEAGAPYIMFPIAQLRSDRPMQACLIKEDDHTAPAGCILSCRCKRFAQPPLRLACARDEA